MIKALLIAFSIILSLTTVAVADPAELDDLTRVLNDTFSKDIPSLSGPNNWTGPQTFNGPDTWLGLQSFGLVVTTPGIGFFQQIANPLNDVSGMTMTCPQCGGYATGSIITAFSPPGFGIGGYFANSTSNAHVGSLTPLLAVGIIDSPGGFDFTGYTEERFEGVVGQKDYQPTGSGYTPNPADPVQGVYATPYQYVRLIDLTNSNVTGLKGDVYVNKQGQIYNIVPTFIGNNTFAAALPVAGDILTVNNADMGDTGSGATWTVVNVMFRQNPTPTLTGVTLPNGLGEPFEFDVANSGIESWQSPIQGNVAGPNGVVIACESRGGNNCTWALGIGSNIDAGYTRMHFNEGIQVFNLRGCDGQSVGLRCDAIEYVIGDQERWWTTILNGQAGQLNVPMFTITADNNTSRSIMSERVTSDANGLSGHMLIGGSPGGISTVVPLGITAAAKVTSGLGGADGTAIYSVDGGTSTTAAKLNLVWLNGSMVIQSVADPGNYSVLPSGTITLTYVSGTASGWSSPKPTITITSSGNPGSGMTDGTYSGIPLFDPSGRPNTWNGGESSTANFTISGGVMTATAAVGHGFSFQVGDPLSPRICTSILTSGCITVPFTGVVTGSIALPVSPATYSILTVTGVTSGTLTKGALISGTDGTTQVPYGETIVSQIAGANGGIGIYRVSIAATVAIGSATISASTATPPVVVVETTFDSTPTLDINNVVNPIDSTGTTGNYLRIKNAIQGASPSISAVGQADADVSIALNPLRNGSILLNGVVAPIVQALVGTGSRPMCTTATGQMEPGTLSAGLVTCP